MDNSDRWVEKYGESFMDFPLKGLKFKKTAWTKKNNHTHCLFCGDEITMRNITIIPRSRDMRPQQNFGGRAPNALRFSRKNIICLLLKIPLKI